MSFRDRLMVASYLKFRRAAAFGFESIGWTSADWKAENYLHLGIFFI